jgi:hypothetical protein
LCHLCADRHTSDQVSCKLITIKTYLFQYSLKQLVDRISKECKAIKRLVDACPRTTCIELCYSFRIRRQETTQVNNSRLLIAFHCFQNVKQIIKDLLKRTEFDRLCCFEQKFDNFGDNEQESWHYCIVELESHGSGSYAHVRIIVDLDPETLKLEETVKEGDDALPVPADGVFKFQGLVLE